MQRTLDLHYDKLVIGADLSALFYSYKNNVPLISLELKRPHRFSNQLEEYNNLLFKLACNNLTPFSNLASSIRLDDNKLKVVTKNNLVITVTYNKLIISDDHGIEGLPITNGKTSTNNLVIDYIDIISGNKENVNKIITPDGKLIFYLSETSGLDLAYLSYIDDSDLDKFEFSESASRLKCLKLMKDFGFKGRFDKTNNHFKPVIIKSVKRVIYPLGKNIYDSLPENIEILYE